MTPNYAPLGKRIVRDPFDFAPGGFYYSLTLPHVDVETSKLARVVPDGILTADGKLIELDVIIYATGLTLDWLSPIEVIGRGGVRLSDEWRDNNPSHLPRWDGAEISEPVRELWSAYRSRACRRA
jgi:4-hydroxyacetophenone monooxygenase